MADVGRSDLYSKHLFRKCSKRQKPNPGRLPDRRKVSNVDLRSGRRRQTRRVYYDPAALERKMRLLPFVQLCFAPAERRF